MGSTRHGGPISLLVRDRSGWTRLPFGERLALGYGEGVDVPLADAPDGACLRLRRDADQIMAVGRGAASVRVTFDARPRALAPLEVVRMGAVALLWVAEVEPILACPRANAPPLLRLGDGISAAPNVWAALGDLLLAAASDWPLVVLGASGTGKELAARLAHRASARADGPMVAVNAAALPTGTLHAELFGARRGAYTGSVADREGAFGRADGGTLFIDEIGELDAAAQAALLRVLETGEITPLGGETRRVDVRLIAATHRDLAAMVEQGAFRLDLLHRLAVATVALPPLSARDDDAALILEHLLGRPLDEATRALVRSHRWPGNLRELRNVARRVQISIADGRPTAADVRAAIGATRPLAALAPAAPAAPKPSQSAQRIALVASAVAGHRSTAAACRASGLPRATFYRLLRELRAA